MCGPFKEHDLDPLVSTKSFYNVKSIICKYLLYNQEILKRIRSRPNIQFLVDFYTQRPIIFLLRKQDLIRKNLTLKQAKL